MPSPDEVQEALHAAAAAIFAADQVAVTCHITPDGDALGSALALAHAARMAGKDSVASFGGPFLIPPAYRFLDMGPLVPASEFPKHPEVLVVFDVASADRLGELAAAAAGAGTVVIVDHHVTNDGFGDIQVIDPNAAASAQLGYYLLRELGWKIDARVAAALLTGIVTDTGRYQYAATDAEVMRVAADLLETGVRPEMIGQHVYESVAFGYLSVSSAVLGRAVLDEGIGLVWSVMYDDDLETAGIGSHEIEGLIDDLRIAREAGVAALLKQVEGGFKVSLRSRGAVDVGAIAAAGGGGGHHNAAGFTSHADLTATIDGIRAWLRG